ncbi:MAG: ferritin [Deltaproteobacteria bacterium]|nr:ferritin [Deltaproteobacteria bacterium]
MLDRKMLAALNDQVNAELYSAYLYLAMSAHFESMGLPGFASWMKVQAQEEMVHAMKFFNFILDRGGKADLAAIEKPKGTWKSASEMFGDALAHEEYITKRIHDLVALAAKVNDKATESFLQWYVDEQVEEEKSATDMLQKTKMVEKAPGALYFVDREAATRVFTMPAGVTI